MEKFEWEQISLRRKLYYLLPCILVLVSFGPYLLPGLGVRLEHIVIYPLATIMVFALLVNKRDHLYKEPLSLMMIWGFLFAILSVRSLTDANTQLSSTLSGVDSMLFPIAIMLFFTSKLYENSYKKSQQRIIILCKTLIFLLSLNTLWILVGFYVDLSFINQFFWGSVDSVARRAATNGRYSGIFNQPMESGLMYSLGMFAWLYVVEKAKKVKLKHTVPLVLLFTGGFMGVSKVFIFGGVALFFVGLILSRQLIKRPIRLVAGIVVVSVPTYIYLNNKWSGMDRLLGYFDLDRFSLSFLTAGRFGGGAQQSQLFSGVWEVNPLIGLGFGNFSVFDSAFFYFFGSGGILALSIYIFILLTKAYISLKYIKVNRFGAESRIFMLITMLIIGSSIGAPVLTLNRVSTVIWVFIGLLLQHYHIKFSEEDITEQVEIVKKKRRFKRYKLIW